MINKLFLNSGRGRVEAFTREGVVVVLLREELYSDHEARSADVCDMGIPLPDFVQ